MYEKHFGLKGTPFRTSATGADVFVGPASATIISSVKKVVAKSDAVICVSGPVGVGKSIISRRALEALGQAHTVIKIGRLSLGDDEVLEMLCREMGVQQLPAGTIQKLTILRLMLEKFADNNVRVFIIVEDAIRLGKKVLAELEALTSSDSGVSSGATIVLMSEEPMKEFLKSPAMERLDQRVRLRKKVLPMDVNELRGYLTHCFRQAGGDFKKLFCEGSVELLHELSGGIPRIVNTIVESSLQVAADQKASTVNLAAIQKAVVDDFDLSQQIDISAFAAMAENAVPQESDAPPAPAAVGSPVEPDVAEDPVEIEEPVPEAPAASAEEPADEAEVEDPPIPELIQDTLPDMEILAPDLDAPQDDAMIAENAAPKNVPDSPPISQTSASDGDDGIPTLFSSAAIESPKKAKSSGPVSEPEQPVAGKSKPSVDAIEIPGIEELPDIRPVAQQVPDPDPPQVKLEETQPVVVPPPVPNDKTAPSSPPEKAEAATPQQPGTDGEIPEWDRDPTLAELRPDLKALERAMAFAQGDSDDKSEEEELPKVTEETAAVEDEQPEIVPEITLDDSIMRKIDVATEALKATQRIENEAAAERAAAAARSEEPVIDVPMGKQSAQPKKDEQADMQLEKIAAELAKAKSIEDVDDKLAETLFGVEFDAAAAEALANPPGSDPANDDSRPETVVAEGSIEAPTASETPGEESGLEREFKDVYGVSNEEVSIETDPATGLDISASQRIATTQVTRDEVRPAPVADSFANSNGNASNKTSVPEPIEDQIDTVMTQTLKTFKVQPVSVDDDDDTKGGFFSRFKRS